MKATFRNRTIKGIFALGLALTLSIIYLPNSAQKEQRQEESLLKFDLQEDDYRKIANTSGKKIKDHLEHAIYLTSSGDNNISNHLRVSKEIIEALRTLMPQMQLVDKLRTMQNELAQGDYYLFHYDALNLLQKVNEVQSSMPEFSATLKTGLQSIEALIKDGGEHKIITQQFSKFYIDMATEAAYIPVNNLENYIKVIEKTLNQEKVDQNKLLTLLNESKQCLQYCNNSQETLMVS